MKSDMNKRERVRRASLAVMAVTAPLPAIGVALTGSGLPWTIVPAVAGVVTVATMTERRQSPPIPAPIVYPERITVQAYVVTEPEPEPDLNLLRALIANGAGR